jgi:DNA-binding NtrC family response regulator
MSAKFDTKKYRIMVVDDEPSVLFTYRLLLQQQGYQVIAVPTCQEALEKLRSEHVHLVLSDYALEERHTGFEIFDAARQKLANTPCILLTGYANREAVDRAESQGITVVFKPTDMDELLATIPQKLREFYEQTAANAS